MEIVIEKFKVELPDEIAAEWAPTGEFRRPRGEEMFLSSDGMVFRFYNCPADSPRLILRRKFVWPEWLTCRWIARDMDDQWWGYVGEKPDVLEDYWSANGLACELSGTVDTSTFPDVPWQESLRENPRRVKA